MKAKRVSQNAPDRLQTPGAEPRTASTSPRRVESLHAFVMSKSRNKRVPGSTRAPETPPGSPKAIASVMEDEVKEPSEPASPQEGHTREDTSQQWKVSCKEPRSRRNEATKKRYGPKDAYNVSVASLILTVCAFCAGLAISVHSSSSAAWAMPWRKMVWTRSAPCWSYGASGAPVLCPRRSSSYAKSGMGIAIMFVLLGWLVAINGMATLASHEEADNHSFLLGLSVPSAFLFGFLGFYKLRIAHAVDNMALRKDRFCSLAGACLSCGAHQVLSDGRGRDLVGRWSESQ